MKLIDVKSNSYIGSSKEIHNNGPKFKIGCNVRISKYKSKIKKKKFAKVYTSNWSEKVFEVKKVTVPSTYIISNLNGEEIVGTFYEKVLKKANQKEFRIEKVIKRKGDRLYVKWKAYGLIVGQIKKTKYK